MIQNGPCSHLIQFSVSVLVRVLNFLNVDISLMLRCYLTEIHKTLNTMTGGILFSASYCWCAYKERRTQIEDDFQN